MGNLKLRARRRVVEGRHHKPTVSRSAASDMEAYAAAYREDLCRHYEMVAQACAAIGGAQRRS